MMERLGLRLLHQFDPEVAHGLSIKALKSGLAPLPTAVDDPALRVSIAGLDLPNPVGLAAGYDKNAEVIAPLMRAGFGFVEVGAATPRAQPGNPKPGPHLDFATVNVSSPNTEKLRDLQGAEALSALLAGVMQANASLAKPLPIFLKIAPDLTDAEISEIADVATQAKLSAIITTNTTLDRDGLNSQHANEKGGLSGAPLFEKSTRVLAKLKTQTDIPLIGVGGISTADQAYAKIKAGAAAVQVYTGLVYQGLSMVRDINLGLIDQLKTDGYTNISQATGTGTADWL